MDVVSHMRRLGSGGPISLGEPMNYAHSLRMPESQPRVRTSEPVSLDGEKTRQALLAEVYRTRSRAAQLERDAQGSVTHQSRGGTAQTLLRARWDTLEALENYSAALRLRGWPTPLKMVHEIQLLRSLCGVTRARLDT
jgi:hypothetical protein